MFYIGLDPSFLHSGVSIINEKTKEINMKEFGIDINKKSTISIFQAIPKINLEVFNYVVYTLGTLFKINLHFGIEVSRTMGSWMQGELFALDYDLYQTVLTNTFSETTINLYSNAFLSKSLLGHRSSEKEKTIYLVEDKILPIFEKHNYKINKESITKTKFEKQPNGRYSYKDTITDGCADSMIYALRQFILYSEDEVLKNDILQILPNLIEGKEMN